MYIIHFQRNAHSMNGLWCEKSLWGFQAPHGARCIDCTLFRNGSSVRANKWEPKKNEKMKKKKKKKTRNEKLIHRLYGFLLKAKRKSCTYRHIDVFISHSLLELWTMLLQASEEWTPKPSPSPLLLFARVLERTRRNDDEKKNSSINKKQNMCTVHCKRSFLYLILLRSAGKRKQHNMGEWEGKKGEWEEKDICTGAICVEEERRLRQKPKNYHFLLLLRLFCETHKKWNSNGICCCAERCWADNFSSLCFSSRCDCYVNISWSSLCCVVLFYFCASEKKKKTFPGGINVISFMSEWREKCCCFYHFNFVNWKFSCFKTIVRRQQIDAITYVDDS